MKTFILTFFILFSCLAFGQEPNHWAFNFKFKINTKETIRYKYKNVEVFINNTYNDERFRDSELKFDSQTQEYSLRLNYSCISCGYPYSDFPPEIYLKINLGNDFGVPFSTIIPIYFQKSETFKNNENLKNDLKVNLGTIEIKHFLTDDYYWKDKEQTFEIIDVKALDSIKYSKSGEYIPRRMNRLIKLEFK